MTWNPVTGCLHGCPYCYARKIARRFAPKFDDGSISEDGALHDIGETNIPFSFGFDPTIYRNRLSEPQKLKKSSKIFVCSMADLFGEWVPDEWINEVMKAIAEAPQHTYMFLTKNPDRYCDYFEGAFQDIPEEYDFLKTNLLCGTTITTQKDLNKLNNCTLKLLDFLSIEPLFEELDLTHYIYDYDSYSKWFMKWVIIGAETGNRKDKVIPKREWIEKIVNQCRASDVPVFMKNSLKDIWGEKLIQEFPKEMNG